MVDTTTPDTGTAAATARFRCIALAVALLAGPWGLVAANGIYAWMTRQGGSDLTGAGALALAGAHPGACRFSMVMAMFGSMLLVPAAIGAMRPTHHRAARLGLIGGVLVAAGYICYFAMVMSDRITLAMAAHGDHLADYAKVLDDSLNGASVVWVYLTFLIGNIAGTFLLGLALLRSRSVPAWAGWGVMGWPILHVIGLVLGTEWLEVAGALAQALGFASVAIYLLRQPRPGHRSRLVIDVPPGRTRQQVSSRGEPSSSSAPL